MKKYCIKMATFLIFTSPLCWASESFIYESPLIKGVAIITEAKNSLSLTCGTNEKHISFEHPFTPIEELSEDVDYAKVRITYDNKSKDFKTLYSVSESKVEVNFTFRNPNTSSFSKSSAVKRMDSEFNEVLQIIINSQSNYISLSWVGGGGVFKVSDIQRLLPEFTTKCDEK